MKTKTIRFFKITDENDCSDERKSDGTQFRDENDTEFGKKLREEENVFIIKHSLIKFCENF